MKQRILILFGATALWILTPFHSAWPDFPTYPSNPFVISISERPMYGGNLIVADANDDGLPDYLYRTATTLYALNHDGNALWQVAVAYPGPDVNNFGTKFGAGDTDGDGQTEVAALDNSGHILILRGSSGSIEKTLTLREPATGQLYGHVAIANLRGAGDRDALLQTMDVTEECHTEACG